MILISVIIPWKLDHHRNFQSLFLITTPHFPRNFNNDPDPVTVFHKFPIISFIARARIYIYIYTNIEVDFIITRDKMTNFCVILILEGEGEGGRVNVRRRILLLQGKRAGLYTADRAVYRRLCRETRSKKLESLSSFLSRRAFFSFSFSSSWARDYLFLA